jgi:diguanylate cyclase (GGDEF)-like protein
MGNGTEGAARVARHASPSSARPASSRARTMRVMRTVLPAGVSAILLFAGVDRNQSLSMISATLGIILVGVVVMRQLGEILHLEQQLFEQEGQLAEVSGVVEVLNASANVGGALGGALERLIRVLNADAGAVWLAQAGDAERLTLVEQCGFPDSEAAAPLLDPVRAALSGSQHSVGLHCIDTADGRCHCVSARMGQAGEELGFVTLVRRDTEFSRVAASVVAAVGADIGGTLRSVRMVTEARRLADRDPLTGLLNHRSIRQRLNGEMERHIAGSRSLAILMLDLDNFKLLNDTYGHPAGDEVLKRVSHVLRRACRETDIVGRYGGDEFMVILPDTALKQAVKCAERIQLAMAREKFRYENSEALPLAFSYGIGVYPEDADAVPTLVAIADANLYQSKSEGGNRITAKGATEVDRSLIYSKGFDLFRAMIAAVDNKDGYTRKHSEEVTEYSLQIARGLGLGEDFYQTIRIAGILHDVGKIGVPDEILRKPGQLTADERAIMQQHPVFGGMIVGVMPGMETVVEGVRYHHEHWDGTGYPDRLNGEAIPLLGRLMAVADAYSAMTTDRPYRKKMTPKQALAEIQRGIGTQFDPTMAETFIRVHQDEMTASRAAAAARRKAEPRVAIEPAPAPSEGLDPGALMETLATAPV